MLCTKIATAGGSLRREWLGGRKGWRAAGLPMGRCGHTCAHSPSCLHCSWLAGCNQSALHSLKASPGLPSGSAALTDCSQPASCSAGRTGCERRCGHTCPWAVRRRATPSARRAIPSGGILLLWLSWCRACLKFLGGASLQDNLSGDAGKPQRVARVCWSHASNPFLHERGTAFALPTMITRGGYNTYTKPELPPAVLQAKRHTFN